MAKTKPAKLAGGRKEKPRQRGLNGQVAIPAKYVGKSVGHGIYMAAMIEGELVVDDRGKPVLFSSLPFLDEKVPKLAYIDD